MRTVAVTGAAGFVGRALVGDLLAAGHRVVAIDRNPPPPATPGLEWVQSELLDTDRWKGRLEGVQVVIHLAAVTGKAPPATYLRTNVDGTVALLEASRRAGVDRFVFVSSIAVTFGARQHYHYAESKIRAEAAVRASGLSWTIVRPTMVFGVGSPVEESLRRFATLPLRPVFGTGAVRIQPVSVSDVVTVLRGLVDAPAAEGATLELGGPETLTMNEVLARLGASGGRARSRRLRIPLGPIRALLGLVEPVLRPVLPFTAGQLASFANDSVAEPHPLLSALVRAPVPAFASAPAWPPSSSESWTPGSTEPSNPDAETLAREFHRYSRYIAGTDASEYQTGKYVAAHGHLQIAPGSSFDRILLRVSALGPVGLRLADAYSGTFRRNSVVRAKLVLALAILESSPPSFEGLDDPGVGPPGVWLAMTGRVALAAVALGVSVVLLAPIHVLYRLRGGGRVEASK